MFKRVRHMLVKEFLQLLRDPRMRIIIFAVPLLQMCIFAFGLTTDVTDIKVAVLDMDRTPQSRELTDAFSSSGYFQITEYLGSPAQIADRLDRGRVRAVIHIPAGLAADRRAGRPAAVQIIADGTDSNTTSIILGYANQILAGRIQPQLIEAMTQQTGRPPARVEFATRAWYNANLESRYYFVPGLIAVMILVISMILTSVAIVREREVGTIEQVMVTPITTLEFILGKTIPYALISYVIMTMMLALAMLIFGVRIQGSTALLYGLTGIYILGNLGLALFISVTARTQQQAVLTVFMLMMPCVLLSGFLFPVQNMPEVIQYATWLNPMRWYIDIMRGVVIKGTGVDVLWPAITAQSLLALGFMTLAASRFKKTLA